MNVVECQGITKNYGKVKALNNLSFDLKENKITGLVGRNGAGKTTLLKIIAGFLHQTSGNIRVFSENPFNNLKVSSNMIFIDDGISFPASLNLSEILQFGVRFYKNFNLSLALDLLEYFNINLKNHHQYLSKGTKSIFNCIIGISARSAITIFDEPTTGMDAAVRKDFYRAVLKEYVAFPRTILISSHHLNEIEDLIEDILLIKNGEKCLHLPITDLNMMAVGLRGKSSLIGELSKDKEIYYQEGMGIYNAYVVIKNDFSEDKLQKIKASGIEILPVAPEEMCIYLTNKTKGGINSVFGGN